MSRVDVEAIQTTRSEKLLAVILVVFLLIGGIWTYQKIDDYVRDRVDLPRPALELAREPSITRERAASEQALRAHQREQRARQDLEIRREAYRTALEAKEPARRLERRYKLADAAYERAQRERSAADRAAEAARPAATAARLEAFSRVDRVERRRERFTFGFRLLFVLVSIAAGYWLLALLRRANSRYFPLAGSVVAFAAIMALVLAGDYVTDYFDPFDLGVLVLALTGAAATLVAFFALQRYLSRRLPARRVRKRQCPFCGYPAGGNAACEGCGRDVLAPCARCEAPRRVGTRFCGACGAAS